MIARSPLVLAMLLLASRAEAGSRFLEAAQAVDESQRIVVVMAVLAVTLLAFALVVVPGSSMLFRRIQLGGSVLLVCSSAVWVAYEARLFLDPYPHQFYSWLSS